MRIFYMQQNRIIKFWMKQYVCGSIYETEQIRQRLCRLGNINGYVAIMQKQQSIALLLHRRRSRHRTYYLLPIAS